MAGRRRDSIIEAELSAYAHPSKVGRVNRKKEEIIKKKKRRRRDKSFSAQVCFSTRSWRIHPIQIRTFFFFFFK
jgi:hypothetical protein